MKYRLQLVAHSGAVVGSTPLMEPKALNDGLRGGFIPDSIAEQMIEHEAGIGPLGHNADVTHNRGGGGFGKE